jgi:ubiquinone/menaquinone biosynthesis C-methylase UbiE
MNKNLEEKIRAYYKNYYRDECSLPDWEIRVESRLDEESIEKKRMNDLVNNFSFNFIGKKHLLVGAGTGGLAVCLKRDYQAEVFGVEPNLQEFEIIKMKCLESGIDPNNFILAYGESLPFEDESFDFVHCFTVIEHVNDVEKCIDEMIRVTKKNGRIIINTPNYRYPYEKHYKIFFPTFLPKIFGYIYLLLLGKNYKFYSSIQRVTESSINKILIRKENIKWYRLYSSKKRDHSPAAIIVNYLFFKRFVYPQQDIVIIKK